MSSIIDLFGSAVWYDPSRLTETGSRRSLNYDMYVVAQDFWRALETETEAEGLRPISAGQIRLFDPDTFRAERL